MKKELSLAMTQEIGGKRVKVLPVLLENRKIPAFLQDKLYADFRDPAKYGTEIDRIVKRVSGKYDFDNERQKDTGVGQFTVMLNMQDAKQIAIDREARKPRCDRC